jgi:2-polyprenyl-6-methoxyphenol hydroxylase-like FAD-dependent oxidoreductase
VEVEFADGEKVRGDVVVGCDGAKSVVRNALCGKEIGALKNVPVRMFNFPYRFGGELARQIRGMNPLFITCLHPEHGSMFWLSSKSYTHTASFPALPNEALLTKR